jgi:hypothetical protein
MAGNNASVGISQDGVYEAELSDRCDDLIDLLFGMRPRIARIRSKRAYRAIGHRKRRHGGSGHLAVIQAVRTVKEQIGAARQISRVNSTRSESRRSCGEGRMAPRFECASAPLRDHEGWLTGCSSLKYHLFWRRMPPVPLDSSLLSGIECPVLPNNRKVSKALISRGFPAPNLKTRAEITCLAPPIC